MCGEHFPRLHQHIENTGHEQEASPQTPANASLFVLERLRSLLQPVLELCHWHSGSSPEFLHRQLLFANEIKYLGAPQTQDDAHLWNGIVLRQCPRFLLPCWHCSEILSLLLRCSRLLTSLRRHLSCSNPIRSRLTMPVTAKQFPHVSVIAHALANLLSCYGFC